MVSIILLLYCCHILHHWLNTGNHNQPIYIFIYQRNYTAYCHSLIVDMGTGEGLKKNKKPFSCSATVSNMSEMLTLIKSWFFFCHKLHMGCPVFVFTCNVFKIIKNGKKNKCLKRWIQSKTQREVLSLPPLNQFYHYEFRGWTRPWRTECERRQRHKEHIQHTTKCQSLKNMNILCINLYNLSCAQSTMFCVH